MKIQYLEIVTADVDEVCNTYSQIHEVSFGQSIDVLGGARIAKLESGGYIGIRAPMHETEEPIIRPYWLVANIESAVSLAAKSGAIIALSATKLGEYGTCAILIQGGVQIALWQL
jgi:predicted enzyme related to lactoylglutathione lyase